ncbi:30S ribosomal protein S18 [Deferrisoma camini]|uniref:30S ribosomal protein S18 n=1 Tax=Deferrisoma camini TaxID=1035120 RepID=UPI00046D3717|nr:30S ribosomal protein S18 [Deferrisoma camini]NOY45110.1 30S ribosomal protein S18 [Deltaproteobacteria bacterium]
MAHPYRRRGRRKVCRFCVDPSLPLNYKHPEVLRQFLSERAKIVPRRISGNCSYHQRLLTREIKRARNVALLPFTELP